MHVEHALVQRDVAHAEHVAQRHDGELQHDHRQRRPADGEAYGAVDAVERVWRCDPSEGTRGPEGRPATGSEAERVARAFIWPLSA
jgi:hypothetical protein